MFPRLLTPERRGHAGRFACMLAATIALADVASGFVLYGLPTAGSSFDYRPFANLIVDSGQWQVVNGNLVSSGSGPADIITLDTYGPYDWETISVFGLDVHMLLTGNAGADAGVIYGYEQPGEYCEFSLSAAGVAQLRSTDSGITTVVASRQIAPPGSNRWLHVYMEAGSSSASVQVDGVPVFEHAPTACAAAGDVGLITRNGGARFDDFHVRDSMLIWPYVRDFDHPQDTGLPIVNGTWSVSAGELRSTAVGQTDIAIFPMVERTLFETSPYPRSYTLKARVLNEYGARGNLVGFVWGYTDPSNYYEAVFSPTGMAHVRQVVNGLTTTLASAAYEGGGQRKWLDMELAYAGAQGGRPLNQVKVNGRVIFQDLGIEAEYGELGVVTHWARARFDWIKGGFEQFRPLNHDFNDNTRPSVAFSPSDGWVVQNGLLESRTVALTTFLRLQHPRAFADIDFRVRMRNLYGARGNLVGVMYGWQAADDFYEVVFNPTGKAYLRRVLKGQIRTLAEAPVSGAEPGRWFEVRVTQRDSRTTVHVNGQPIFTDVYQPDSTDGYAGLVTHWSRAEFDDLSLDELTRYRHRTRIRAHAEDRHRSHAQAGTGIDCRELQQKPGTMPGP